MRALVLVALLVLAAGCSADPRTGSPRVVLAAPAGQVVFRVEGGGGMVPADVIATRRPGLTVYANGDAYVLAPDTSRADNGPLALRRGHVPHADLVDLVALAGRSGLFGDDEVDFGEPSVTDMGSTVLTFRPGRAVARTISAYALSWTRGEQSLSYVQRVNRATLRALLDRLFTGVPSTTAWMPPRLQVSESDDDAEGRATPWPGPAFATLLAGRNTYGRPCGVVTGPLAERIRTLARAADADSWRDAVGAKKLVFVDLLPDEPGC